MCCLINKIKSWFAVNQEYYNGSEDDLYNILLELQKTLNKPFSFKKRLKFLVNEALFILEIKKQNEYLTQEEVNNIIIKSIKKLEKKPKKKTQKTK